MHFLTVAFYNKTVTFSIRYNFTFWNVMNFNSSLISRFTNFENVHHYCLS